MPHYYFFNFYLHFICISEQNCRDGMKIARRQFGIPLILRPEHLASPDLDELSLITYLAYFVKVGAPGYNATLQCIQPLVRNTPVFNFTVCIYTLLIIINAFRKKVMNTKVKMYHILELLIYNTMEICKKAV